MPHKSLSFKTSQAMLRLCPPHGIVSDSIGQHVVCSILTQCVSEYMVLGSLLKYQAKGKQ